MTPTAIDEVEHPVHGVHLDVAIRDPAAPVAVLFIIFQRYFVRGANEGSTKG